MPGQSQGKIFLESSALELEQEQLDGLAGWLGGTLGLGEGGGGGGGEGRGGGGEGEAEEERQIERR